MQESDLDADLMFFYSLTKFFTCTHTVFMVLQGYLCVHVPRMRVEDRQAGWKVCVPVLFSSLAGEDRLPAEHN